MRSRSETVDVARHGLAAACERALLASARAQRAASRQQLRAAARKFVRRHQRDAGYLAWVLCSVGASTTLAVALLGLGAAPAHAKATAFNPLTGAVNPLEGLVVGNFAMPALGDLDSDGDLDLVTNNYTGVFRYFENTGSSTSSAFVPRTGPANPLDGQSVDPSSYPSPTFGDLDRDGDLDLVLGSSSSSPAFRYFQNTGTASSPAFAQRTGAQNPLDGQELGYRSTPVLVDLDGDGDLDLVAGQGNVGNALGYLENTGDATNPAFIERTGSASPVGDLVAGYWYYATPALGDLDGDGDIDLVAGQYYGDFWYFENTGNAASPIFVRRSGAANPLDARNPGQFSTPALGDLDGDGDLDLVSGHVQGDLGYFENLAGRVVVFFGSGPYQPLLDIRVAELGSAPALGDLDHDGDLDLVSGSHFYGLFRYFENTGSATSPAFAPRTGAADPFDGLSVGVGCLECYSTAALGDLDGDGDLDLVAGEFYGAFFYFENTGSAASPAFAARTGAANPLDGQDVGVRSKPTLGDVDGDGDLDLVAGDFSSLVYFENTGSAASPGFVERTGAQDPFDGQVLGYQPSPSLGDLDGDGDLDLFAAAYSSSVYFENTGTPASPAFLPRTGVQDTFPPAILFTLRHVTSGDLDGDGDLDIVCGDYDGFFPFLENAILEPSLSAIELSGGANPLAGADIGAHSTSALGDLDADGDLDLVAGAASDPLRYFENTRNAVNPAFVRRTGSANPFDDLNAGIFHAPALGDLDGDGDFDVVAGVSGENLAALFYFENTGGATTPAFVARTGAENPVDGEDVGPFSRPSLGDLDGDGDLDLLVGERYGHVLYFENTGDVENPAFMELTGAANPLDGVDVGDLAAPVLGDVDGDGDLDLVSGDTLGTLAYFENTGDATSAAFILRTGAANPLGAYDLGDNAAPALGDLDADGDLDLVSGAYSGEFRTFYLPEPGHGLLLGVGVALLSLLARLRRRWAR